MHDWTRVDSWVYHDFHTGFIVSLCRGINERLPAKYYAMKEQSLNVMIPDVMTRERSDSVDDEPSTTTLDNSYHSRNDPPPRSHFGTIYNPPLIHARRPERTDATRIRCKTTQGES